MYDAYIMYPKKSMETSSYEMDIFVLKVLPEVLEKQCSYRLFIIGRDDVPGQGKYFHSLYGYNIHNQVKQQNIF